MPSTETIRTYAAKYNAEMEAKGLPDRMNPPDDLEEQLHSVGRPAPEPEKVIDQRTLDIRAGLINPADPVEPESKKKKNNTK